MSILKAVKKRSVLTALALRRGLAVFFRFSERPTMCNKQVLELASPSCMYCGAVKRCRSTNPTIICNFRYEDKMFDIHCPPGNHTRYQQISDKRTYLTTDGTLSSCPEAHGFSFSSLSAATNAVCQMRRLTLAPLGLSSMPSIP